MPRIVSSVFLSLTMFLPRFSISNHPLTLSLVVFLYPLSSQIHHSPAPPSTLLHVLLFQTLLKVLNSSSLKSSCLDFISCALLKFCPSVFADLIAWLANLSFNHGQFPTLFKKQVLISLFSLNYCPIPNLDTISNIIERIFLNRGQSSVVSC